MSSQLTSTESDINDVKSCLHILQLGSLKGEKCDGDVLCDNLCTKHWILSDHNPDYNQSRSKPIIFDFRDVVKRSFFKTYLSELTTCIQDNIIIDELVRCSKKFNKSYLTVEALYKDDTAQPKSDSIIKILNKVCSGKYSDKKVESDENEANKPTPLSSNTITVLFSNNEFIDIQVGKESNITIYYELLNAINSLLVRRLREHARTFGIEQCDIDINDGNLSFKYKGVELVYSDKIDVSKTPLYLNSL